MPLGLSYGGEASAVDESSVVGLVALPWSSKISRVIGRQMTSSCSLSAIDSTKEYVVEDRSVEKPPCKKSQTERFAIQHWQPFLLCVFVANSFL